MGSVVVAHGLSCLEACGILVPRPGIKPTSPALEGRFLTTGPPGKSQDGKFYVKRSYHKKQSKGTQEIFGFLYVTLKAQTMKEKEKLDCIKI